MEAQPNHQHIRGRLHAVRIDWRVEAAVVGAGRHVAIDEVSFHFKIQIASQIEPRSGRLIEYVVPRQAVR